MNKGKAKIKNISPFGDARLTADGHLGDYSKSSYAGRLNWLEEASRFASMALKLNRNKTGAKTKRAK